MSVHFAVEFAYEMWHILSDLAKQISPKVHVDAADQSKFKCLNLISGKTVWIFFVVLCYCHITFQTSEISAEMICHIRGLGAPG